MPTFFSELVMRTDEERRAFETHPKVLDAVARGMSLERYRALLLELYHVVWYFNPICATAASRLGSPALDEAQPLRHFLYEHMHEEMGHETWVLNDLQAVGVAPEASRGHRPGAHTLALVGYNHWASERRHPCSAFGMLYALEVVASVYGGPFAAAIREALLLEGDAGVSFIESHASMDARHMAELRDIVNRVGDPAGQAAVVEAAQVNFHHLTRIVEAI